jgi:hypothetical protein
MEDLLQHNIRGPTVLNNQVLELITSKNKAIKIAMWLLGYMFIAISLKIRQFIKIY